MIEDQSPYKEIWLKDSDKQRYDSKMKRGFWYHKDKKRFTPPKGNNPYEEVNRFKKD